MTRRYQNKAKCPECGAEVDVTTPFSSWLRNLDYPLSSANYSNQNLDYIWHFYRTPSWFITIEEKRYGGKVQMAQSDTHNIVAQLLALASGSAVQTQRGARPVEYRGHYIIIFENTTPDDSAWVRVNGVQYSEPAIEIKRLLSTGKLHSQPTAQQVTAPVRTYANRASVVRTIPKRAVAT